MNWRHKALLQNAIAKLPPRLSYELQYLLQRTLGGLRRVGPTRLLRIGVEVADALRDQGRSAESAVFVEIGTGWQINLSVALWLCGASKVTTVDLHPYLKEELVADDLRYIRDHQEEVQAIFGEYARLPLFQTRFHQLVNHRGSLEDLLAMMNVHYLAPADARSLDIEPRSVDYYLSFAVLQHLSPEILKEIIRESARLLKPDGLFIHWIDMGDHFAHSDPSISPVNFLQFSEQQWSHLAGNRWMYQNRLRVDDYVRVLKELGAGVLKLAPSVNRKALNALQGGLRLDARFAGKDMETNATTSAWIVGRYFPETLMPLFSGSTDHSVKERDAVARRRVLVLPKHTTSADGKHFRDYEVAHVYSDS